VIGSEDVIISNHVSFLEYIFLEKQYSPIFTQIAERDGKFGLRKLGLFEIPLAAMGLRFPPEVNAEEANFYSSLTDLRASLYVKSRPIVVFPEGTKTNGRGILQLEDSVVSLLVQAANSGLKLHTLRFDYEFEHASPYNTTDVPGIMTLIKVLTQVTNVMTV
jgi:1-acyl-sn-glycerol-3-phosphate acyltransferase